LARESAIAIHSVSYLPTPSLTTPVSLEAHSSRPVLITSAFLPTSVLSVPAINLSIRPIQCFRSAQPVDNPRYAPNDVLEPRGQIP
jgi:hypothetical protein